MVAVIQYHGVVGIQATCPLPVVRRCSIWCVEVEASVSRIPHHHSPITQHRQTERHVTVFAWTGPLTPQRSNVLPPSIEIPQRGDLSVKGVDAALCINCYLLDEPKHQRRVTLQRADRQVDLEFHRCAPDTSTQRTDDDGVADGVTFNNPIA